MAVASLVSYFARLNPHFGLKHSLRKRFRPHLGARQAPPKKLFIAGQVDIISTSSHNAKTMRSQPEYPRDGLERKLGAFQGNVHEALDDLIGHPQPPFPTVWHYFLLAFRYRRQFPWLGESQESDVDGLAYAFRDTLRTYVIPTFEASKRAHAQAVASILGSGNGEVRELPSEWISKLRIAATDALQNISTVKQFAIGLSALGADVDVLTLPEPEIRGHLLHALVLYWERRDQGTSRDP